MRCRMVLSLRDITRLNEFFRCGCGFGWTFLETEAERLPTSEERWRPTHAATPLLYKFSDSAVFTLLPLASRAALSAILSACAGMRRK